MTPDQVVDVGQQAMRVIAMLSAPVLICALVVGILIGLFQALTQINEATLSFVPKLFVIGMVLLLTGPWMMNLMINFTRDLILAAPQLIG